MELSMRIAGASDIPGATRTITSAFEDDPAWGWVFDGADPAALNRWWSILVTSALRYPWLHVTDLCESVSLWIPPDGVEVTPEEEEMLGAVMGELGNERAALLPEILESFESSHPREEPHFYLSLWGTHADHRGQGFGGALIHADLAQVDELHMPAYLESTNDENLGRYERLGFERYGSFVFPRGGPTVTTMWRPAR